MLTADKILDAALTLVDERGVDNLTMRSLAGRLDVTATAIYYYFDGRDAILEALLDRLCARIASDTPAEGSWDERLQVLLSAMVEQAIAHPKASAWAIVTHARRPPMLRLHEAILSVLLGAGFPPERAMHMKGALLRFCVGHITLNEAADGHQWRQLPKKAFPNYRATGPSLDAFDPAEHFRFGLQALLAGLAANTLPEPSYTTSEL
jgi:TetR/AcrR family tetracycline transcriptional repressor